MDTFTVLFLLSLILTVIVSVLLLRLPQKVSAADPGEDEKTDYDEDEFFDDTEEPLPSEETIVPEAEPEELIEYVDAIPSELLDIGDMIREEAFDISNDEDVVSDRNEESPETGDTVLAEENPASELVSDQSEDLSEAEEAVPDEEATAAENVPDRLMDDTPEKSAVRSEPPRTAEKPTLKELTVIGAAIVLIIANLADLFMDFGAYDNVFLFLGFTLAAELFLYLKRRKKPGECKGFRAFGKILLVAAVLETTIFQFPSFHLMFGDYEKSKLSPASAIIDGGNYDVNRVAGTVSVKGQYEVLLTYPGLEQEVGTVGIRVKADKVSQKFNVVLDVTDETSRSYRYNIAQTVITKNSDEFVYIPCQFSGDVGTLRIKFTGLDRTDQIEILGIYLNKQIPFSISLIRLGFIVICAFLIYAVAYLPFLRRPFYRTRSFCRRAAIIITAFFLFLAMSIVFSKMGKDDFKNELKLKEGNQITKELVDAFEAKQLNLLESPRQQLVDLENPYDWSERSDSGVYYLWDHLLYDGKYYSYYGIAPVVLLFLPYHKLTGYYFSTAYAVLLFSMIGIIFLSLTYMAIAERWFRKVSAGCIMAGHIVILSACGIWFCIGRPLFYEISLSSGFAFVALSAYFLIRSNILCNDRKTSLVCTALASLFSGIAVLCRPTLAVYSICLFVYFMFGIKKAGYTFSKDPEKAVRPVRRFGYLVCAGLPLMILAAAQMWYNMARFGSPFDFGIQYSLTINDFTHSQYHTHFVFIALRNYLFAVPSIYPYYPFISTPFTKLDVNGYYFSDIGNTSGILFLAFPVFAYILFRRALKRIPAKKDRVKWLTFVGLPCIVMPLVILFSIWESGYAVRYVSDFSWQIIIGALAVLFYLYQKSANETKKSLVRKFMAVSAVCAFIINGMQIFNFAFPTDGLSGIDYHNMRNWLEQLVVFWR